MKQMNKEKKVKNSQHYS